MRKENKNINPCHSREGGNPGQLHNFIITWIAQSSWAMTVCALSLLLSLSACGEKKEEAATSSKPTIKIGVNLPLTGGMAFAGENMQKSLELAMQEIKKIDNLKYNYELLIEDNIFDSKRTILNLNRFNSIEKVNAVISLWGTAGTVTSEFAEKNKLVHMSCSCSEVVGRGLYNFNHATKPQTHMKRIVKYYKEQGYKRIGLLYDSVYEVEEFIRDFKPMLKENGFEIVYDTSIIPGEKDLRTEVIKIKVAKPDVLYVQIVPPALMTFSKQRKEMGLDVPLTSMNVFSFAMDYYEGEVFFTEDSGKNDWVKFYQDNSGLNPMPCTVNMYDGLKMLVEGFEKSPSTPGSKPLNEDVVKTMLNNKDFKSVLANINIDAEGNIDSPSVLKKIINGTPVSVQ